MKKLYLVTLIFLLFAALDIQAAVLYTQPVNSNGGLYQSSWLDPDGSDSDQYVWDNFTLSGNASITKIEWGGGYDPAKSGSGGPALDFRVQIFPSIAAGTEPKVVNPPLVSYQTGNNAGETLIGVVNGINLYSYSFSLPQAFDAVAGTKYWIQIEASQNGSIPDWGIASGTGGNGLYFRKIRNPSTGDPNFYQIVTGDAAFTLSDSTQVETNCFDGIDNDNDGFTDCADSDCAGATDGACDTGSAGICSAGILACINSVQVCQQINQPQIEICDLLDNDCNGQTDENLTQATTCGVGACAGNTGTETCTNGTWGNNTCNPFAGATAEVCDGINDNDCDGTVDEGCVCTSGVTRPCGSNTGECAAGTETCVNGVWEGICAGAIGPAEEVCDGKDNDCDNATDENFTNLGMTCTAGVGACEATGIYVCTADGSGIECNAAPDTPGVEGPSSDPTCSDGIDNDCDEFTDSDDDGCSALIGDVDGDRDVDFLDHKEIKRHIGRPLSTCPLCDINGDGKITLGVEGSKKAFMKLCTRALCAIE